MYKMIFIKKQDEANSYDSSSVKLVSTAYTLPEILENFTDFLRGCGFSIGQNESIEVVKNELQMRDEYDV